MTQPVLKRQRQYYQEDISDDDGHKCDYCHQPIIGKALVTVENCHEFKFCSIRCFEGYDEFTYTLLRDLNRQRQSPPAHLFPQTTHRQRDHQLEALAQEERAASMS